MLKKNGLSAEKRQPIGSILHDVWQAVPSLALVVIVMGGILLGIFTPTEAGAIAVVYSLVLSMLFYREVGIKQLSEILTSSIKTTAIVMFLIATSSALSWVLAYENIPQSLSETLLSISDNPIVILLIINLILLLVGSMMDMTPAVLIFTPIFLPIANALGVDPIQFGIIIVLNLSIGLCTPPVGSILFVACAVSKTKLENIIKPMLPLYVAMIVVLMLVTYIPGISLALPNLFSL